MPLQKKDLVTLAIQAVNAKPSLDFSYKYGDETFSYSDLQETLRDELRELAGTYSLYRENKNLIFSIMEEVINDILPKKVMEQYGMFAEVKTYAQGDKPIFTQRITVASKRRAKQFVTRVGLAGTYEVFQLDGKSYEVETSAYGGAAQIGFEEFLDKRIDFADVLEIILEGLDESLYAEIAKTLIASVTGLQAANKTTQNTFVEAEMDKLIAVAASYGQPTIYCTYEFAATMVPSDGWVSDAMKDMKWNNGYLANYKGNNVIVLSQSFADETNSKKVIDSQYAWIIPSGGNDKPVKIALEGDAIVNEYVNRDLSREIQIYKKLGVASTIANNICVYANTSLAI